MQIPESQLFVIFGASGDLTRRKLMPALYNLFRQNQMPEGFAILGSGRTRMEDDSFRKEMFSAIPNHSVISGDKDRRALDRFLSRLYYIPLNVYDSKEYENLRERISSLNRELNLADNIIYYLATPPVLYEEIPLYLAENGLNKPSCKLIIEKPFGNDFSSAIRLNRELLKFYTEDQLYRIDHYLGKETVQNILVTRFSNHIFEPLWNRNYVHHVEITSSESDGVGSRGGY